MVTTKDKYMDVDRIRDGVVRFGKNLKLIQHTLNLLKEEFLWAYDKNAEFKKLHKLTGGNIEKKSGIYQITHNSRDKEALCGRDESVERVQLYYPVVPELKLFKKVLPRSPVFSGIQHPPFL